MSRFFGEAARVGLADAVGGAGDDGHFVFQSHGHLRWRWSQ